MVLLVKVDGSRTLDYCKAFDILLNSDREGIPVSQPVLHNVINSLVSVEEFKKKLPLKV